LPESARVLHLVLIKPTHYDDNGYPIQWLRSAIPSNTLACLNGLAEDCRKRKVLGYDVDIHITTYDETNRRVHPNRIIRSLQRQGGRALIALVGVQSNQFPRALDLARRFRERGLQVCIGGFHVSGCVSMLPELPDDLKAYYVHKVLRLFPEQKVLKERAALAYPLFGLKWCLILLNEFLRDDSQRRHFASHGAYDPAAIQEEQLEKARNMQQKIRSTYQKCPFLK